VTERFDWRKHLAVHPAADLFPPMSEAELKELAEDIKNNGLHTKIVVSPYAGDKDKCVLIDGRNRLDALALLGCLGPPIPRQRRQLGHLDPLTIYDDEAGNYYVGDDPFEFTILRADDDYDLGLLAASLNLHRRHLTVEQRRDLIAKVLKATPEKSNNQIAKEVNTDDKTVATVRADLESRSEIPNVDTRTDTKGRKQPAKRKPAKKSKPDTATENARLQEIADALNPPVEASAEARRAHYEAGEVVSAAAAKQAADDDCGNQEQSWHRDLAYRAGEAAAGAAYSNWQREYGDWSQFKVTPELIALTDQVIESWQKLKDKLVELHRRQTQGRAA
jgi:hypothetical protein